MATGYNLYIYCLHEINFIHDYSLTIIWTLINGNITLHVYNISLISLPPQLTTIDEQFEIIWNYIYYKLSRTCLYLKTYVNKDRLKREIISVICWPLRVGTSQKVDAS